MCAIYLLSRPVLFIVLMAGLSLSAQSRAAAPGQPAPPRPPITAATASQIAGWGLVASAPSPVEALAWRSPDALIALVQPAEGDSAEVAPGPLGDQFPVRAYNAAWGAVWPGAAVNGVAEGASLAVLRVNAPSGPRGELGFDLIVTGPEDSAAFSLTFVGVPGPLAFSPDGAQLVVVALFPDDGHSVIFRFDSSDGALLGRDELPVPVHALRFAPDGQSLLVGSEAGLARLAIEVNYLREMWALAQPPVRVLAVAGQATGPGGVVIAGHSDGTLAGWALDDGAPVWRVPEHPPLAALDVTPAGDVLAVASEGPSLDFRDPLTGALLVALPVGEGVIEALAFSPDASLLATAHRLSGAGDATAPAYALRLWGLPPGEDSSGSPGGPGGPGAATDGPPAPGGGLDGAAPPPGSPPSDGSYPVDPPGQAE